MSRSAGFARFAAGLVVGGLVVAVAPRITLFTERRRNLPVSAACSAGTPQQAADWWLRSYLRSLLPPIAEDTLHVAPPSADFSHYDKARIDTQYVAIFRQFYVNSVAELALLARWEKPGQYEAFLLRVPGEMYGVGVQIWTYDLRNCAWNRGPMISDAGGDGGDQLQSHGWIVDLNGDGHRDLVVREKIWSRDDNFRRPAKLTRDRLTVYYWHEDNAYFAETYIPHDQALRRLFDFKPAP